MGNDYTNSIIENNNGDKIQITNIKGKNAKGEKLYGYLCSKCGTESFGTLDKIKRNKGCKYCKGRQTAKSEMLPKNKILSILHQNNPYVNMIDEYRGKNIECKFKCNKHQIFFYKKPSCFLYFKTKLCPQCIKENKSIRNKKYSIDDIKLILDTMNYHWLNHEEYKDASSLLLLKCKKCNKVSRSNISSLLNGRRCKTCSGLNKKSTDEFKKEVFGLVGK